MGNVLMSRPPNSRARTQRQIADLAGVSREAVSHVLNGTTGKAYNAETRARIRKIAREQGYHAHRGAQAMRNGRSNLIGILGFDALRFLAQRKIQAASERILTRGYHCVVEETLWYASLGREAVTRAVASLMGARVDGILLVYPSGEFTQDLLEQIWGAGIPVVGIASDHCAEIPNFVSDRQWGYEQITRYVLEAGYRRLVLLESNTSSAKAGFCRALEDFPEAQECSEIFSPPKAPPGLCTVGDVLYSRGYLGMKMLLERGELPEVVLCGNDQWAHGALRACHQAGVRVPKDLALTGFDNDPVGEYGATPFTTMDHPSGEIAHQAVDCLLRMIQEDLKPSAKTIFIRGKLIERDSCPRSRWALLEEGNSAAPPMSYFTP